MKVVRLSALRTGRLYPPGNIPGTHFCSRLNRPQGHSGAGRIILLKNSNDSIGNRTRDLLACSAVPQPTTPQRAVRNVCNYTLIYKVSHFKGLESSSNTLWEPPISHNIRLCALNGYCRVWKAFPCVMWNSDDFTQTRKTYDAWQRSGRLCQINYEDWSSTPYERHILLQRHSKIDCCDQTGRRLDSKLASESLQLTVMARRANSLPKTRE